MDGHEPQNGGSHGKDGHEERGTVQVLVKNQLFRLIDKLTCHFQTPRFPAFFVAFLGPQARESGTGEQAPLSHPRPGGLQARGGQREEGGARSQECAYCRDGKGSNKSKIKCIVIYSIA